MTRAERSDQGKLEGNVEDVAQRRNDSKKAQSEWTSIGLRQREVQGRHQHPQNVYLGILISVT